MTSTTETKTPIAPLTARSFVDTSLGRIAFIDAYTGPGDAADAPVALFIHGVFLNAELWSGTIDRVSGERRCIAIDLPAHGWTEEKPGADLSFKSLGAMFGEVMDGLGLGQVDLVANDSGGAMAQIFAARNPERIRTLTLTNCDVHDGWPPAHFAPTHRLIASGMGGAVLGTLLNDLEQGRSRLLGDTSEFPDRIPLEKIRAYIEPLGRSEARQKSFQDLFIAMNHQDTVEIAPQLRKLEAPTLIVWGLDDPFFHVKWAYWLQGAIPGVKRYVEVPTGKLFIPEDRPELIAEELRQHWETYSHVH
jgi:pimeloyl-ACP methyl ester carboxylesterase